VERKYIQLRLPAAGLKYHTAYGRENESAGGAKERNWVGELDIHRLLIIACTFATGGVRDFAGKKMP
jgi:hypothetical protein